jgi:hypothetical protein
METTAPRHCNANRFSEIYQRWKTGTGQFGRFPWTQRGRRFPHLPAAYTDRRHARFCEHLVCGGEHALCCCCRVSEPRSVGFRQATFGLIPAAAAAEGLRNELSQLVGVWMSGWSGLLTSGAMSLGRSSNSGAGSDEVVWMRVSLVPVLDGEDMVAWQLSLSSAD